MQLRWQVFLSNSKIPQNVAPFFSNDDNPRAFGSKPREFLLIFLVTGPWDPGGILDENLKLRNSVQNPPCGDGIILLDSVSWIPETWPFCIFFGSK